MTSCSQTFCYELVEEEGTHQQQTQQPQKKSLDRMADSSFCSTVTAASTATNNDALHCVAFDLQPQIHHVPALSDLTLEERQSTWYSPQEKNELIEQAMNLANFDDTCQGFFFSSSSSSNNGSSNKDDQDDNGNSRRGLEFYSVEGSRRRKLNRLKVVIAVLKEQERQRQQASSSDEQRQSDDQLIQAVSVAASRPCQEEAYIQGCQDEEAVFPQKPRSNSSSSSTITAPSSNNKRRGMLSCFTQLVRDITDIGVVEWAAQ